MTPRKWIYLCLAASLLGSVAWGQTQPWDENRLAWVAPTTCSTGEPIAQCPVTGYRIERSNSQTGAFTALATTAAVTHTHEGAAAGVNCYRVIALSAQGPSVPSNVACKTNVRPAGPPNPPVLTVAQVVPGLNMAPVYKLTKDGKRDGRYADACGFVPLGVECERDRLFQFREQWFHRVPDASVVAWGVACSGAAPCA